jgi:solute carrier family 35 protein F1/2
LLVTTLANAAEEFFVRQSPLYEVVGQLGMWGTLINGVQAAALEHHGMTTATWNGAIGKFTLPHPLPRFVG